MKRVPTGFRLPERKNRMIPQLSTAKRAKYAYKLRNSGQGEVEQLTKDAQAYIADLHETEQTEQTLRDELDQANQRAATVEADARTAVEQAQQQTAELRGRAEQLAQENARLNTLIGERLSQLSGENE